MHDELEIHSVADPRFARYGRVVKGMDGLALIDRAKEFPPSNEVIYIRSCPELKQCVNKEELEEQLYGKMRMDIGICYGENHQLNALEYHRNSEFNLAVTDMVLLLGAIWDIKDGYQYDTDQMEAFLVPQGTMIEVYATTLHYAPCCAKGQQEFRSVVFLPEGTNDENITKINNQGENQLLLAKNKWVLAHGESDLAEKGAFIGLNGVNWTI